MYQSNFRRTERSTKRYEVAATSKGKRHRFYENIAAVTVSEMKRFLGIILFMGNHKLPNRRMYLGNFADILAISATITRN